MTTSISLDHPKRLKQSFDELATHTQTLCQRIDNIKTKIISQIKKLKTRFKQTEWCSRT